METVQRRGSAARQKTAQALLERPWGGYAGAIWPSELYSSASSKLLIDHLKLQYVTVLLLLQHSTAAL